MDQILLDAQARDTKVSPLFLRKNRKIPAVFYGHKEHSMALQVDYQSFRKVFKKAGGNQIVELQIDGKKKPVLIHEVQWNPLTDRINHVDFIHVNMSEEITAMIPLEVSGIAPAVKNFGGILTTLKHEIEVRCLPADLPQNIKADVSGLETLHSSIHIKDLNIPKNVKIVHAAPDDVVLTVVQPKLVEEEAALPQAPTEEAAAAGAGAEGADAKAAAPAADAKAAPAKKE